MPLSSTRTAWYLLAYASLFALFEGWSYTIAPSYSEYIWRPSAGLHLALALLVPTGPALGAIALAVAARLAFVFTVLPVWAMIVVSVTYAGIYVAAARVMQRYFFPPLASLQTARTFLFGALATPWIVATITASVIEVASASPLMWGAWLQSVTQSALTESAGMLTVTPALALLGWTFHPVYAENGSAWIEWIPASRTDQSTFLLEWLLVPLAIYLAFFFPALSPPQYYVCFIPVLWMALRHGLPAASVAALASALGISLAMPLYINSAAGLVELHLFLIVLASAGLLVGMLISERNRAQLVLASAGKRLRGYLPPDAVPPAPSAHRPSASSAHVLEQSTALLTTTADQIAALNSKLKASEQRLRDALAASNRMMSILSHDLKNPLVGIRGLAEVLGERITGAERSRESRMLRLIQQSSQQALDMVENLLLWSRLDTNKMAIEPSRSSIHLLVDECFALLGGTAQHKDIELINQVSPATHAYIDPRMITIVLRNLVSNAVKFTDAGGRTVVSSEPLNKEWIVVMVTDTGIGLSASAKENLLSGSDMHATSGTAGEMGTGLGLQLCKEMIQRHEGRLWVESTLQEGSTFYFTLPREPDVQSAPSLTKFRAKLPLSSEPLAL